MQGLRGVAGRYRKVFFEQHGAGIQSGIHLHNGNAGIRVSRQQGALDRRRPAPTRQERSVNIETAQARNRKDRRRQDQAIGGNHHDLDRRCA